MCHFLEKLFTVFVKFLPLFKANIIISGLLINVSKQYKSSDFPYSIYEYMLKI